MMATVSSRALARLLGFATIAALLSLSMVTDAQSAPAKGRSVTRTISTPSIEGNLIGDSSEKAVTIYLPPSYDVSQRRYPVVYFLPGYGGGAYYFPALMERLISTGSVQEMIIVTAPGEQRFGGSFYVNSPVTGNWENLIAQDVVAYVDADYRTIPQSASRGIAGHSMGGYGALHLAMLHPDVFGAVYSLSPGLFDPEGLEQSQMFSSNGIIQSYLSFQARYASLSRENAARQFEIDAALTAGDLNFAIAYGQAFAGNADVNAPYIDYPYHEEGTTVVRDEGTWKKWEAGFGGIAAEAVLYRESLLSLAAIGLDYGTNDEYAWIPKGCAYYAQALAAAGVPVEVSTHTGGHERLLRVRIEQFMLPFFSRVLRSDP